MRRTRRSGDVQYVGFNHYFNRKLLFFGADTAIDATSKVLRQPTEHFVNFRL